MGRRLHQLLLARAQEELADDLVLIELEVGRTFDHQPCCRRPCQVVVPSHEPSESLALRWVARSFDEVCRVIVPREHGLGPVHVLFDRAESLAVVHERVVVKVACEVVRQAALHPRREFLRPEEEGALDAFGRSHLRQLGRLPRRERCTLLRSPRDGGQEGGVGVRHALVSWLRPAGGLTSARPRSAPRASDLLVSSVLLARWLSVGAIVVGREVVPGVFPSSAQRPNPSNVFVRGGRLSVAEGKARHPVRGFGQRQPRAAVAVSLVSARVSRVLGPLVRLVVLHRDYWTVAQVPAAPGHHPLERRQDHVPQR